MDRIPGDNVTEGARREDRREGEAARDGELPDPSRNSDPICCSCGRLFQSGMRYSWTEDRDGLPDGRQRCAACTKPGVEMQVFA